MSLSDWQFGHDPSVPRLPWAWCELGVVSIRLMWFLRIFFFFREASFKFIRPFCSVHSPSMRSQRRAPSAGCINNKPWLWAAGYNNTASHPPPPPKKRGLFFFITAERKCRSLQSDRVILVVCSKHIGQFLLPVIMMTNSPSGWALEKWSARLWGSVHKLAFVNTAFPICPHRICWQKYRLL